MPTYFVTSDATAAKLKADGLTFEYINTDKEAVEAKNYTEQLGPKVPATAMTLAK
jgi:ribose transport system substrate-binding protein